MTTILFNQEQPMYRHQHQLTTDEIAQLIRKHTSPGGKGLGDVHGGQTAYIIYENEWPHIAAALNRAYGEERQPPYGKWVRFLWEQPMKLMKYSNVREGELIVATQTMDHITKGRVYKVEKHGDFLYVSCDAYPTQSDHKLFEGPNGEVMGFTSMDEWQEWRKWGNDDPRDASVQERELLTKEIALHRATIRQQQAEIVIHKTTIVQLEADIKHLQAQREKDASAAAIGGRYVQSRRNKKLQEAIDLIKIAEQI